jgi:hypothetical protein
MPAPILHVGATVMCSHAGQASPSAPSPRVTVSGQPITTIATPYVVAGCALASGGSPPCATGQWTVGATRVMSTGVPVVIQSGSSTCLPTGQPMLPLVAQVRVVAT